MCPSHLQARSDSNPFLAPIGTFSHTNRDNPNLQSGGGKLLQAQPPGYSQAISAMSFRARSRARATSMGQRRREEEWSDATSPSRLPFAVAC